MESASTEDVYRGLYQWWLRYCQEFSMWYLSRPENERADILHEACPDMPLSISDNKNFKLTDVIVPDMNFEALQSLNGKCLILFITRSISKLEHGFIEDIRRLKLLQEKGSLPDLTNGVAANLRLPHVNPLDPSENIMGLHLDASIETQKEVLQAIHDCKLVELSVWLCVKLRRMTVSSFILGLAEIHQRSVVDKPSPTVHALIQSEIAMRVAFDK